MEHLTKVVLTHEDEVAVVKVSDKGNVVVERNNVTTDFRPEFTIGKVVSNFQVNGWAIKDTDYIDEVTMKVDDYIQLHEEMTKLKSQLDKKKKELRKHMEDNGLQELKSSGEKSVKLVEAKAPNSTAVFSNYLLQDIMHIIPKEYLNKVTEIRVNSDKLEGILKSGLISKDVKKKIESARVVKEGTPHFKVMK